jgi:hypothetical protein
VIVIQYEKLVQDLRAETTAVLEHLGQEWSDQILDYASDANTKTVYSPSYVEVTQPVHTNATGRWEHYREQLEPHLQSMNNLAEQLGY